LEQIVELLRRTEHIRFISSCRTENSVEDEARFLLFELLRGMGLEPRPVSRAQKGASYVEEVYVAHLGETPIARVVMDIRTVQKGGCKQVEAEVVEVEMLNVASKVARLPS